MGPLLLPMAAGLGALVIGALGRSPRAGFPPIRGENAPRRGTVRPLLGKLTIPEAQLMLQGLMLVNVHQLLNGERGISEALFKKRLRYERYDPHEHWRTIREIWEHGGGDCEDLAAAVAAEQAVESGQLPELISPAYPVLYQARPHLWHAVVQEGVGGPLVDPSRTGGMGRA